MAINTALFGVNVFQLLNYNPIAGHVAGNHHAHNHVTTRSSVTLATIAGTNLNHVTFTANAAGDTIYLPYGPGEVHSMVVPNPPPPGVTSFVTANMSGCRLYIDQHGGGDYIVYHANLLLPGGGVNPLAAATETHGQAQALDGQVVGARPYYAAPPFNYVAVHRASIGSPTYRRGIVHEVQRKNAQNRNNVQYLGGTTIAGSYAAGAWHFYWQTWSDYDYRRPVYAPKGWGGNRNKAINVANIAIVDRGQIL